MEVDVLGYAEEGRLQADMADVLPILTLVVLLRWPSEVELGIFVFNACLWDFWLTLTLWRELAKPSPSTDLFNVAPDLYSSKISDITVFSDNLEYFYESVDLQTYYSATRRHTDILNLRISGTVMVHRPIFLLSGWPVPIIFSNSFRIIILEHQLSKITKSEKNLMTLVFQGYP